MIYYIDIFVFRNAIRINYLDYCKHGLLNTRTSTLPCAIKIPDDALQLYKSNSN